MTERLCCIMRVRKPYWDSVGTFFAETLAKGVVESFLKIQNRNGRSVLFSSSTLSNKVEKSGCVQFQSRIRSETSQYPSIRPILSSGACPVVVPQSCDPILRFRTLNDHQCRYSHYPLTQLAINRDCINSHA